MTGKPSKFPTDWSKVSGKPASFPTKWNDIQEKPNWAEVAQEMFKASNMTVVHKWICGKGTGPYDLEARCPSGTRLISCMGSAGDLHDLNEGYWVKPNLLGNSCQMRVLRPACDLPAVEERQTLYAMCIGVSS